MAEWLHRLVSLGGIALCLTVAGLLIRSLMRTEPEKSRLHLVAFCVHCGWEGRVARSRMTCARCGSTNMSIVAT